MSNVRRQALDAINELLRDLEAAGASPSTIRQRKWSLQQAVEFAARELSQGLSPTAMPDRRALLDVVYVSDIVDQAFVDRWAADEQLDPRAASLSRSAHSASSVRAGVASVRALARREGLPPPQHPRPSQPLRSLMEKSELNAALSTLAGPARGARPPAAQVRLAGLLAVMVARPRRTHELAAMGVSDVVLDSAGKPSALRDQDGEIVLRGVSVSILQEWLIVRRDVMRGLSGGAHDRLWVTVKTVPTPHSTWAAGLPLRPRGMQRSYAAAVLAANDENLGRPGFPLPRSLDLLRRSILGVA